MYHWFQFFRDKIRRTLLDCRTAPPPPLIHPCDVQNGGCQHYCIRDGGQNHHCECGKGYQLQDTTRCVKIKECHVNVDVVFVIDSSDSVTEKSFEDAMILIKEFVRFIEQVINEK